MQKILLLVLAALAFCQPAMAEFSIKTYTAQDTYSIGAEGFHDTYKEPGAGLDLTDTSNYGAVTANWTHYFAGTSDRRLFIGLDGRGAYSPNDNYKSDSGRLSGARQYEFDGRLLTGLRLNNHRADEAFSPYLGIGVRHFRDESKGLFTDLGDYGYDRRITQLYLPLGLTYNYTTENGVSFTPNIEGDLLLRGFVQSRLQNGGGPEVNNIQDIATGYGLRAEFMVGVKNPGGLGWEFGPFVRYWEVRDSQGDLCTASSTPNYQYCYIEPHNTRSQYGAELRLMW